MTRQGTFTTPPELTNDDCYSLEVECEKKESMRLKAYHCATGTAFDGNINLQVAKTNKLASCKNK